MKKTVSMILALLILLSTGMVPALAATEDTEPAAAAAGQDDRIGAEGVTVTVLRPAGQIEVNGARLNAASNGDFIPKGARILITGREGDHYVVKVSG